MMKGSRGDDPARRDPGGSAAIEDCGGRGTAGRVHDNCGGIVVRAAGDGLRRTCCVVGSVTARWWHWRRYPRSDTGVRDYAHRQKSIIYCYFFPSSARPLRVTD